MPKNTKETTLAVWTQSCMSRIFPMDRPPARLGKLARLHAARGEYECFQVGIHAAPFPADIEVEPGELRSRKAAIPANCVKVFHAGTVPVPYHPNPQAPGDLERVAEGHFPDPLHSRWEDVVSPPRRVLCSDRPPTGSLWVRVEVPRDAAAGTYSGRLVVRAGGVSRPVSISLQVAPFELPRPDLHMTNWFHPDLMAKFCGIGLLNEEFWQALELYAADMALHGQDTILTPLGSLGALLPDGTPPQLIGIRRMSDGRYRFDFTAFDRWCELFFRHGFRVIEGGHQAGGSRSAYRFWITGRDGRTVLEPEVVVQDAKHRGLLRQLLGALRSHLSERGWLDRYVQHVSDEPHGDQLGPYTELTGFVKECLPGVPIIDAMGDPAFSGLIDQPVPVEHLYEEFAAKAKVPLDAIWLYYCCSPAGQYPNRFIDYPLVRVRIFTWLAWKHRIRGFLHWGYNFWTWHPPVRKLPYNPYDNATGGVLPAGDNFVVYPPVDPDWSRAPVPSIRWEIIGKAMHDYSYLTMLDRELNSGGSPGARSRALQTLRRAILEKIVPSFKGHTRDAELLIRMRMKLATLRGAAAPSRLTPVTEK